MPESEVVQTEIKVALLRARLTPAKFARKIEVSRQSVYQVIQGKSTSRMIKKELCRAVGWKFWPGESDQPFDFGEDTE